MNSNKIISYNDYISDTYQYDLIDQFGRGEKANIIQPNDIQKFFAKKGFCSFCNNEMTKVIEKHFQFAPEWLGKKSIWECDFCGWWEVLLEYDLLFNDSLINDFEIQWDSQIDKIYHYGIAKKFNIEDKKLPLDVLMSELNRKKMILTDINPYKLEVLTQSILSDFFNCEVLHVGKTGDGGIDLIVINSDDPIMVQVKRRKNPNHIELVQGVRDFLGALYYKKSRKGIYVTTAKDFSKGVKTMANNLIKDDRLTYFELINYDKLYSLINFKNLLKKPWEQFAS